MPFHIQKEVLILKLMLRRSLYHMEIDYSFVDRSFDLTLVRHVRKVDRMAYIEMHNEMLGACPILADS